MDEVDPARSGAGAVLDRVGQRAVRQSTSENFPVALRLLPRRVRADLLSVYTFARFVDDIGDEAPGDRAELLDVIEAQVRALTSGRARLAPVAGLGRLVRECGVPTSALLALIDANRADQHTSGYESFENLLGYCALSAAPVGEIVLHIAEAATAANLADSARVCAALQVLEHCQDVGEDLGLGRVYLPAADLRAAGIDAAVLRADLAAARTSRPVRDVVATQVRRSRELLTSGRPLVGRLHGWSRRAVAGYVAGGLATADALDAADYDVLTRSIRPSKLRTAGHASRLMFGRSS